MAELLTGFLLGFILAIILGIYFYFKFSGVVNSFSKQFKTQSKVLAGLEEAVKNVHRRIDGIFIIDKPSENEATKEKEEAVNFSEGRPLDLPTDLKVEVEGGDTMIPPQFS